MKSYPIVTISVINYNDKKCIFKAIESAVNQTYPNLEIIIADNASTDGTKEEIASQIQVWRDRRQQIQQNTKLEVMQDSVIYIQNQENLGFGKPHNQAMRIGRGEFVLLLNSDAILTEDFVESILPSFADPEVGSVQGKLLRYDFSKDELYQDEAGSGLYKIDTVGLQILKNRRIVCIGQGELDRGQFNVSREIFGVDGAVPVYRKSALEDIKLPVLPLRGEVRVNDYEYFDEDFFLYKEDVDLAWRLRLRNWKAIYIPAALAYHGRGSGDSMAKNYFDIIKERRKINVRAKYYSFLHQRLMQLKNEFPELLFGKHFGHFIVKEVGAWGYMMMFERFTLRLLKNYYRLTPLFWKKRKIVMSGVKVEVREFAKWFM